MVSQLRMEVKKVYEAFKSGTRVCKNYQGRNVPFGYFSATYHNLYIQINQAEINNFF